MSESGGKRTSEVQLLPAQHLQSEKVVFSEVRAGSQAKR